MTEKHKCSNCGHNLTGHCALYSSICATQVLNGEKPYRWISEEEGLNNLFKKEKANALKWEELSGNITATQKSL